MEKTVGIDWGSQEHAVCVLHADGSVLTQFTVPHTAAGLAELVRRLARCGPPERLRVGIERPSGLLVDTLVDAGHPVVPIHPNVIRLRDLAIEQPAARAIATMRTSSPTCCARMATVSRR